VSDTYSIRSVGVTKIITNLINLHFRTGDLGKLSRMGEMRC